MDITVSVKCSDEVIRIDVNELNRIEFFRKQLSNFGTGMTHETKTITDTNGETQVIDYYTIPQISVGCKSSTLLKLMSPARDYRYNVWPGRYDDDLIEFFMYNDMYGFGHLINFATYGFMVSEYFDLLLFIKKKLRLVQASQSSSGEVNVYEFIQHFYFSSSYLEHSFEVCHVGGLDHSIIPDMLVFLDKGLMQEYHCPYQNDITIDTLKSIVYCCNHGFIENINATVNTDKIKKTIEVFVEKNRFNCKSTFYCNNRSEGMKNFKTDLAKIYEVLRELDELGIIRLQEINPMEKYIQYMTDLPTFN